MLIDHPAKIATGAIVLCRAVNPTTQPWLTALIRELRAAKNRQQVSRPCGVTQSNRSDCLFVGDPIPSALESWNREHVSAMKRLLQMRIPRLAPAFAVVLIFILNISTSAPAACRDPDVAGIFPTLAYAAEVDATIQYFGHNFFLITTRRATRIVTDPLGPGWYPNPNVAGDVVTVGKEQFNHNAVQIVRGNPLILRGLKNYGAGWNTISTTVKDTLIYNVPIHQNSEFIEGIHGSAFVFDLGPLCIAHLGDLSQKLNDQQIKAFGKVDVALTPIGGRRTMDPALAREVLTQLKPKIAIPMHHRDSNYLVEQFSAGMKTQMLQGDTLTVSKNALPLATEIKVLQPRGAMVYR